jgi:hypothetical protein
MALQDLDVARALAARDPAGDLAAYRATDHGSNGGCAFVAEFGGPLGEPALPAYVERMDRTGDVGRWFRSLGPLYLTRIAGKAFFFTHGDVPEALLSPGAVERYGREVTLRLGARSDEMGGTGAKYGDRVFTSSTGSIFWCREFRKLAGARPAAIVSICDRAGVDYIVTGHSVHPGKIFDYSKRIFDIDVGMTPAYGGNLPQALIVSRKGIAAFDANGREKTLVPFGRTSRFESGAEAC